MTAGRTRARRLVRAGGLALAVLAGGGGLALAEEQAAGKEGMHGYREAMKRMQENMPHRMSGDPDEDFVRHMIPHHRAAVDMAEIEARRGKDPEVKEMASRIAEAQKAEIERMEKWLKDHPSAKK